MRPYMLAWSGRPARFATRRLASGGSVIVLQQSRKVLAGLGVKCWADRIARGLMPPPWQGRPFDVFPVAIDHLTRLVDAMAYLLEKFGLHRGTPLVRGPVDGKRKIKRERGHDRACRRRAAPFVAVARTYLVMATGSCSGSLPRDAPRDDGGGQGFRPSSQKRGMGTRQDGKFRAGKNYSIYGGIRSSTDLESCQSCAAERQSIQSQCVGATCAEIHALARRVQGWAIMIDHNYRVCLTTQTVQHVIASTVQLHGDQLVFVNSKGQLTALFLKNLVRSWNMLPNRVPDDTVLRRCQSLLPRLGSRCSVNFINGLNTFPQSNCHADNLSQVFYFCPVLPPATGGR
jgi:hypothetical protein